jgi:hypothetical protein
MVRPAIILKPDLSEGDQKAIKIRSPEIKSRTRNRDFLAKFKRSPPILKPKTPFDRKSWIHKPATPNHLQLHHPIRPTSKFKPIRKNPEHCPHTFDAPTSKSSIQHPASSRFFGTFPERTRRREFDPFWNIADANDSIIPGLPSGTM